MHDDLVRARDQFIAHSDEEIRKVDIYPPGAPVAEGFTSGGVSIAIRTLVYPISEFKLLRRLCYDLGSRIDRRTNALLAELYEGRELPRKPFLLTIDDEL